MRHANFAKMIAGILVPVCLVSAPTMICAQTTQERPFLDISGEGTARTNYDSFTLNIEARGTGQTRPAALASASANADKLRSVLNRIESIAGFRITSAQPNIVPVGPGCENYGPPNCNPTSYAATVSYAISATPARGTEVGAAAGAALVVLEEQGFSVSGPNYGLTDTKALSATARRLAFDNAKLNADLAAQTAGCTRGKLLNITLLNPGFAETVIVTGSRISANADAKLAPSFNLSLEAGTARVDAQVRAKFELICRAG